MLEEEMGGLTICNMSKMNKESYPPIFRQTNHMNKNVDQKLDYLARDLEDRIPLVDLQSLNLDQLEDACKRWSLFRLVNHGIPPTLLSEVQDHTRRLFSDLSFASKQSRFTSPLSYFWGTPALTPSGSALRCSQSINWVEGLNVPLNQLPNLQVEDNPCFASFKVVLEEYGKHLARIAATVFEAMSKNLNLDSKNNYLSESTGSIRVYRYPICSKNEEQETTWGMNLHTDSSVLSILNQDEEISGLEILKDGEWFTVKPIPHTLVVNLGDMMQAISNDEYKSVQHRVKVSRHKERISICYFIFPDEDCVIQSPNYKPFTYCDFQAQVQQDIKTLGHKVGLQRFKLAD